MESEKPASEIFDNRRRGEPMIGCDCMQCFGYCMVDYDIARRELPDPVEPPAPSEPEQDYDA